MRVRLYFRQCYGGASPRPLPPWFLRHCVERSFSQMKLIKTRLRSHLCDNSLPHLMKIAIGSPDKLTDSDLEDIVDVWHRKSRRIV